MSVYLYNRMLDVVRKLGIKRIRRNVQEKRLHGFGHVMHTDEYRCIKMSQSLKVDGICGSRRLRKTWAEAVRANLKMLNFKEEVTKDRDIWCFAVLEKNLPTRTKLIS